MLIAEEPVISCQCLRSTSLADTPRSPAWHPMAVPDLIQLAQQSNDLSVRLKANTVT